MSLETPECEAHGGSSHARGKRMPARKAMSMAGLQINIYSCKMLYFNINLTTLFLSSPTDEEEHRLSSQLCVAIPM